MRISYPLFGFKTAAIALPAAIIMIVLLAADVTMTNAQQQLQEGQQQLATSQPTTPPPAAQNGTTPPTALFESTLDSYRVQLPEDWVIQDVNNTGFILAAEVTEGYGILAQLCPAEEGGEEEQQQRQGRALTNVSSGSCQQQQQAQEEIIHIIRYPNLAPRLGIAVDEINVIIPDSILNYQIQKLQEVGYRDINVVNSTDATIDIHYDTAQDVPGSEAIPQATVPARFVEITYSTDSAPSEMRTGYLFLTATNAVPPNEMITGYSVFYEGASGGTEVVAEEMTQSARTPAFSPAAAQILPSFELIASEEVAQSISDVIAQQAAAGDEPNDQVEDTAGEEEGEEDGEEAEDDDG
jgi:HAMP domain-containing protein